MTVAGIGWTTDGDDGQALEYIVMDRSTAEEHVGEDGCTRPPSNSFLVTAMVDRGLVVASSLDGTRKEHCCACDVTEHFHAEKDCCLCLRQRRHDCCSRRDYPVVDLMRGRQRWPTAEAGSSSQYHLQRARNLNFSA